MFLSVVKKGRNFSSYVWGLKIGFAFWGREVNPFCSDF